MNRSLFEKLLWMIPFSSMAETFLETERRVYYAGHAKIFRQCLLSVDFRRTENKCDSFAGTTKVLDNKRLCGDLIWLKSAVLPEASFLALSLQQDLPSFQICRTVDANCQMRQLKSPKASILYLRPNFVDQVAV